MLIDQSYDSLINYLINYWSGKRWAVKSAYFEMTTCRYLTYSSGIQPKRASWKNIDENQRTILNFPYWRDWKRFSWWKDWNLSPPAYQEHDSSEEAGVNEHGPDSIDKHVDTLNSYTQTIHSTLLRLSWCSWESVNFIGDEYKIFESEN